MQPLSNKKRRWHLYTFSLLFVALIPAVILFVQGYRLGSDFSLVRVGGIYIGGVDSDTEIFLESMVQNGTRSMKQGFFIDGLYPGKYLVSVKREGFTSWSKDVVVYGEKVTEVYPMIVPLTIAVHEIPRQIESQRGFFGSATSTGGGTNALFLEVFRLFEKDENSTPSTRRSVMIWKNGRDIQYRWLGSAMQGAPSFCGIQLCIATSTAYTTLEPVSRIDFYPGRNDVVLLGLASGLYALEIDSRPPQHLIQIYSGKNIDFRVEDNETVYIKDGQKLFQAEI